jgi:hypothetical protein
MAVIRERYRADEATGYEVGDLRGAVSVRVIAAPGLAASRQLCRAAEIRYRSSPKQVCGGHSARRATMGSTFAARRAGR